MKTKVCHIISGFLRDDSRIFIRQCGSLINYGYKVNILTNDGGPNEILNNINIYSHDVFSKGRIYDILFAKKYFLNKALEIDADIYQLHGPELIPLGVTLKNHGKIVFYDAHEDLPRDILEKEAIPGFIRPILSKLAEFYLQIQLKKFDEIFTVTPHFLINLKKASKNVSLITNFPIISDSSNFSKQDYLKRDNVLCYAGTVYKYSNQEVVLNSINNIQNLTYQVAGYIDDSHKKKLNELDGSKNAKFLGKLTKAKLNDLFNNSTIGIVIYDYIRNLGYKIGSFGTNKIFEYMQAGLPIICTDFDLWKEIVEKHDCGICVQPNNQEQLENAIIFLINNKEKAFEMGQNGKAAVLSEYNWYSQERLYLEIFQKYSAN